MTDHVSDPVPSRAGRSLGAWVNRLISNPEIQAKFAHLPLFRGAVRRDGAEIFDLVSGFVYSQALFAIVELRLLHRLMDGPKTAADLAPLVAMSSDRLDILLRAGVALGLLKPKRGQRFGLSRKGAALVGVPGLEAMILHHRVLYRDMADPVAMLRGDVETELAGFWPYVFGGDAPPDEAATYSDLMAQTQGLVAQDVLRATDLKGVTTLMDVGGGSGAFVFAVAAAYPDMAFRILDLPAVVATAEQRIARAGLSGRVTTVPGSFRDQPLPKGADAISLIRVLYDHEDATIEALLAKVFDALPPGGRLIIAEPMSGGDAPDRAGDVYFAFYTMAMRTGRTRSADRIGELCKAAGFANIVAPRPARPFVTSVLHCVKPD